MTRKTDTPMAVRLDEAPTTTSMTIFDRVLCGVDGSDESFEAVRQANMLAPAEASFTLFGIVDASSMTGRAIPYGSAYNTFHDGVRECVTSAAQYALGRRPKRVVLDGSLISTTRSLIDHEAATLIAVGAKGASRAMGVLLGSLATELVHAP